MVVLAGGTGDSCCSNEPGTVVTVPTPACTPPTEKELAITAVSQQNGLWCWAACTNMLLAFHGSPADQCAIVNKVLARTECCDPSEGAMGEAIECPKTPACNTAGWLALDEYGKTWTTSTDPLSWSDLTNEIGCDGKAMAYVFGEAGDGDVEHMIVIKGYGSEDLGGQLIVNDPMIEAGTPCYNGWEMVITYAEYTAPSGFTTPTTTTLHRITPP